jgi:hypothetical protein
MFLLMLGYTWLIKHYKHNKHNTLKHLVDIEIKDTTNIKMDKKHNKNK